MNCSHRYWYPTGNYTLNGREMLRCATCGYEWEVDA